MELCCTTVVADKIKTMVTSFLCSSSQKYQGWDKWEKDQRVLQGKGVLYHRTLCVPWLFSETSETDALKNMGPRMLSSSATSLSSFCSSCSWSYCCVFQLQAAACLTYVHWLLASGYLSFWAAVVGWKRDERVIACSCCVECVGPSIWT